MLKTLKIAGAAIILAMLATVTAHAKPVGKASLKCERVLPQKVAKTPFFLVLGVGF
jgi:hypothetical protein